MRLLLVEDDCRMAEVLRRGLPSPDAAFGRITRFTADASHELRTPIAFMRTTAEVALRKQWPETEYRTALAEILSELERTSGWVKDLLLLARADSGSQMQFERIDGEQFSHRVCILLSTGSEITGSWAPRRRVVSQKCVDRTGNRRHHPGVLRMLIENEMDRLGRQVLVFPSLYVLLDAKQALFSAQRDLRLLRHGSAARCPKCLNISYARRSAACRGTNLRRS